MRPLGRFANIGWWVAFILCGFTVLTHSFLLQVNNMPLSPLKLEMVDFLSSYVNPYFVQHWNFFAPEPPMEDEWVVARARLAPLGPTKRGPPTDALAEPNAAAG
jgi:hypothetical protein